MYRKLIKDPLLLRDKYVQFLQKYEQLAHMSEINYRDVLTDIGTFNCLTTQF